MTEPTTVAGRALLRQSGFLSLDDYTGCILAIEAEARASLQAAIDDLIETQAREIAPLLIRVAEAEARESAREPGLDVERRAEEARRLLGYLWTATGKNYLRPVRDLFAEDDPIVADVERLAIFPAALASEDRP